jgi:hypothetical protein
MQPMIRKIFIICFLQSILFSGCNPINKSVEKETLTKVPVTVTGITVETLTDFLELSAKSAFLNKAVVKASSAAYIEDIKIKPGEFIKKDQVLFILKTKEARAIEYDSLSRMSFSGLIPVRASIGGVVTIVDHPIGDYLQDGDLLCTIALPSSLVFILEAPFELDEFTKPGTFCEIILPDGQTIQCKISSQLLSMTGNSQTQQFIIQPSVNRNLPENLIVKVKIIKNTIPDAVILPKTCVLTDEVMENFWVMKLINDSIAIKIPVKTGLSQGKRIEIIDPVFKLSDLFLASGNYGLGDTANVIVLKNGLNPY